MAADWYYTKGGEQRGPVTEEELRRLARAGELGRADNVWQQGMPAWVAAGETGGLLPALVPMAGPPPLPSTMPAISGCPWTEDEKPAPNPVFFWVQAGLAGAGLLVLVLLLAFPPGFGLFVLLYVVGFAIFWIIKRMGVFLLGRWGPADGQGWVEFVQGGICKREDGSVGRYVLLPNQRFIDFSDSGNLTDSWKILAWGVKTLEVQDMRGKARNFSKGKTLQEQRANPFHQPRTRHLTGTWDLADRSGEWLQFTEDGAFVFSGGKAGRYTAAGEEPDERLILRMPDGSEGVLRIVSVTATQLVLAEGGSTKSYAKRKPAPSANPLGSLLSRFLNGNSAATVEPSNGQADARLAQAVAHLEEANKFRHARKWDKAIRECEAAMSVHPGYHLAYLYRAQAHNGKGNETQDVRCFQSAVADFSQALEIGCGDPLLTAEAYFNRGCILTEDLGRHEEAYADFERVLRLAPSHDGAKLGL
ncbi:MAG: GYF domain-containing protein, partial [Gemmataceae bacterium]|nr:GYF domain-containing protein [Gemmataceae bacterium]